MKRLSGNGSPTVPTVPELSPPNIEWAVFRSAFPFGIGSRLGAVKAPDFASAQRLAVSVYGANVVVERVTSAPANGAPKRQTPLEAGNGEATS